MRRFELTEGTSSKFWEVNREGAALTVRFGRIGADGQTQTKSFADDAKAEAELTLRTDVDTSDSDTGRSSPVVPLPPTAACGAGAALSPRTCV